MLGLAALLLLLLQLSVLLQPAHKQLASAGEEEAEEDVVECAAEAFGPSDPVAAASLHFQLEKLYNANA